MTVLEQIKELEAQIADVEETASWASADFNPSAARALRYQAEGMRLELERLRRLELANPEANGTTSIR